MKKHLFILIGLLIILTSCTAAYHITVPVGQWQSDFASLTFEKKNEDEGYTYGTYVKDGEVVDVFIVFSHINNLFSIRDMEDMHENGTGNQYEYFCGRYTVTDDKMYCTLLPHWETMHDVKEIVFTRVVE